MQINFNPTYNTRQKTSFNGFYLPYDAESIILARTSEKRQKAVINEIRNIMNEFDNKKVMIELMTDKTGHHLEAAIYDGRSYYEHFKENWFYEMFTNPVVFIRKLAKKGRKIEYKNTSQYEPEEFQKTSKTSKKFESYKI